MTFSEELIELLKKELELLYSLKDISYGKTDIIVSNQVEELENMTKKEEELINEIALKEKEREELLDSWGLDKNASLTDIIDQVPENKENLNTLREDLQNLILDIQSKNLLNNELILENLQWLDFNMNLVRNIQTPPTYGKGQETQGGNPLFDRKV